MAARLLRTLGWTVPSLVLAVALGLTVGLMPAWLVYWLANVAGVWLFCDANGRQRLRTQKWMKGLSLFLLPSGIVGLMAGGGTLSPGQQVSTGSSDEATRKESARATGNFTGPPPSF